MEPELARVGSTVRFEKISVTIRSRIDTGFYMCEDIRGKQYALRVDKAENNGELLPRFKEYLIQKSLSACENVVSAFGFTCDIAQQRSYLLLELCQSTLLEKFQEEGPFDTHTIVDMFQTICSAVNYLHTQNPAIVHRHLDFESVMFVHGILKVGNFQWASNTSSNFSESFRIEEFSREIEQNLELCHRAPELIDLTTNDEIGTKVDIWSLGCLLFRLCTGREPFEGCTPEDILALRYSWPEDVEVDPRLVDMVSYMLCASPSARPNIAYVLSRLQAHFPEWVDKKWRALRPHFFPMRQDGNFTLPVTNNGKNLGPVARMNIRRKKLRGNPGPEQPEGGSHLLEQSSSEALFKLQESRKKNRMALDMTGMDMAAMIGAMSQMEGNATASVRPQVTECRGERARASTVEPGAGRPPESPGTAQRPPHPRGASRFGRSLRHRRKKTDSGGVDITIVDVPEDEGAAEAAETNVNFMLKEPSALVRQIRHLKDEERLRHCLAMLLKSSENVCYGFFFRLIHEIRDPIRLLRNMPTFSNEKAQKLWTSRAQFSSEFGMYDGTFSLRKFRKRNSENFPPVGTPPICLDAVVSLQSHLSNVIDFVRDIPVVEGAEEIELAYRTLSGLTAELLRCNVESERIQSTVVHRFEEHHVQATEVIRNLGLEFGAPLFRVSELENYRVL